LEGLVAEGVGAPASRRVPELTRVGSGTSLTLGRESRETAESAGSADWAAEAEGAADGVAAADVVEAALAAAVDEGSAVTAAELFRLPNKMAPMTNAAAMATAPTTMGT